MHNVITLPTSRECARLGPGCKVKMAHMLFNDSIEYLCEAMSMTPLDQHNRRVVLSAMIEGMRAMEELGFRDALLALSTDCPEVGKCREVL